MNISKKSLIEGLSYALDLAEGRYFSHSKHVAFTSILIGEAVGLNIPELSDLYYTALLHDIGADSHYNIKDHALKGAEMAGKLSLTADMISAIKYHHEASDGSGVFGLTGEAVPLMSRIILVSNLLDIYIHEHMLKKNESINNKFYLEVIEHLNGLYDYVDNEILDVLISIVKRPFFLLSYLDNSFDHVLKNYTSLIIDEIFTYETVKVYADVFAMIIDQRNPFTYNHSVGLANLTDRVSITLGYEGECQETLHIAALLHDIGKLGVDNDIINKDGKLSDDERFEVNKHTYFTRFILSKIQGFDLVTQWASNHHETLDGKGYPFGLVSAQLDSNDRLLAILDIYQALTEERPYRKAFSDEKVWSILDDLALKNKVDFGLLKQIKQVMNETSINYVPSITNNLSA